MKEGKILGIVTIILAIVIVLFSLQLPTGSIIGDTNNIITVTGNAELKEVSDEVTITMEIISLGDTATQAENTNKEESQSVLEALEAYDVQTRGFYLNQKYEWNEELRKSEPIGYEARHSISVTAESSAASAIISAATQSGADAITQVSYQLSDQKEAELKKEALALAVSNAKDKADILVTAAGTNIGAVHSITENNYIIQPYVTNEQVMMADAQKSLSEPEIDVQIQVTISYELR